MRFSAIVLIHIVIIAGVYLWATRTGKYIDKDDESGDAET